MKSNLNCHPSLETTLICDKYPLSFSADITISPVNCVFHFFYSFN